ncbi:hypothetical protein PMAYCL1PPCAC_21356, partial [Pristionchus mayeri]
LATTTTTSTTSATTTTSTTTPTTTSATTTKSESTTSDSKTPSPAASIAGRRCVKSHYGSYLRGWDNGTDWNVGIALSCGKCEQWTVEEQGGKVSLRESCTGKYLRANVEGFVDLADRALGHELWTPVKHGEVWSFQSAFDTFLRIQPHGRVSLQSHADGDEKFLLVPW